MGRTAEQTVGTTASMSDVAAPPHTDGKSEPIARRSIAVRRRLAGFFAVALVVAVADQLTKSLIRLWLAEGEHWPAGATLIRLSHIENSGAAFGILQGAGPFLLLTSAIGIATVVAYLFLAPRQGGRAGALYGVALGAVLGGAVGNLIDRVARQTVTDFIDPTHYPAFNIADSAIVLGVLTLAWLSFFSGESEGEHDESGEGGR